MDNPPTNLMLVLMSNASAKLDPVYNIASIFSAHRDLRPYAKLTLGNSALTVEEADMLVLLLGLREMGWDDCPVYDEGFVNFLDLKEVLVHDPSLFARRIKKLAGPGCRYVEVRKVKKGTDPRLHGNCQQVRITKAGITVTKPIWERFRKLSAELLKGISTTELKAHVRVNELISKRLRDRREAINT